VGEEKKGKEFTTLNQEVHGTNKREGEKINTTRHS
jgi:hypothetical protein